MLTETVNISHLPFLSPGNNTVLGILKKKYIYIIIIIKLHQITNYCICKHFTEVTVYLNFFLNYLFSLLWLNTNLTEAFLFLYNAL